jgi:hypothetical protein
MLPPLSLQLPSLAVRASEGDAWASVNLEQLNLMPIAYEVMNLWESQEVQVPLLTALSQMYCCVGVCVDNLNQMLYEDCQKMHRNEKW